MTLMKVKVGTKNPPVSGTEVDGKYAADNYILGGKIQIVDENGDPVESATTIGITPPSSMGDGRKVVAAAGTAEKLTANTTACKKVTITALRTNTGLIEVGGSTVVAASGTQRGIALESLDSVTVEIDDVSKIYIDSTVNGEGVTFAYVN